MSPLWTEIAGPSLSGEQVGQLGRYLDLLIEKNQVLNLTRITDRADAEVKHVADALTLLAYLPEPSPGKSIKLADVGTGGGIPGVILAIVRPDIQVTLIDSTRKKLDAVMSICQQMNLSNVRALHQRIEETYEKFDIVTARAVAELDKLLGWCEPMIKRSTRLLALKGPKVEEEIARLSARSRKHWQVEVREVAYPALQGHRVVICRSQG